MAENNSTNQKLLAFSGEIMFKEGILSYEHEYVFYFVCEIFGWGVLYLKCCLFFFHLCDLSDF
jgi:hypothetical protein